MNWTPQLRDFIQQHLNDDTASLLLAARRFELIDMPFAVNQIEVRRRLKDKLPAWYDNPDLVMGGRVPAEQCSSEQTARYKREIIQGESLCDLTGGMGVDFWYLSEGMQKAIYTERNAQLCEVAQYNFQVLQDDAHPVPEVRCGDGLTLPLPQVDVIYIDPARRATDGSRVYSVEDCEPNVVEWQDELLSHAQTVLVKLSPMVDITDVARRLKGVQEIHVVGVKNECKEILVKMSAGGTAGSSCEEDPVRNTPMPIMVRCVDFLSSGKITHAFPLAEVSKPAPSIAGGQVGLYLYEPDVTLMKARGFASLCDSFGVRQLASSTHLMTSNKAAADFPGRIFEIEEVLPFSSKQIKRLKTQIPQANIAVRNFVMTADTLRKRLGVKDGGEVYLFGANVSGAGDMLLKCRKFTVK